ncbi:hypothetical protein BCR39DRAFT_553373 [Naematelia encephala]|uniref:Glucose-methanol-choline oxidoreductase N-terminal domain-containing protein n=1 Tax=Naematelia encephala TaxID=71784 RepID=A0A1Y2AH43_9TREE|nr:hypothetical protein BCR39DRAFT_553373 [Naematelia encephala]
MCKGHLHTLAPGNKDLPGASATYAVGGMATHWTCATPRPHPDEMPKDLPYSDDEAEWDRRYSFCEKLIGTNQSPFDDLVGQQIVKHALNEAIPEREIKGLPLAVHVDQGKYPHYPHLHWSGCDTIMGSSWSDPRLTLRSDTHVRKIVHDDKKASYAVCENLVTGEKILVRAKYFVVACGAILSPQLLHVSGLGNENNGRYLTDHPVAFTQVVLAEKHLDWARQNSAFDGRLPDDSDPIPIPADEPDPQLYTPYTNQHPWHTQIHREAFQYGTIGDRADQRTVIHLRWYGKQDPQRDNRVIFDNKKLDMWGMPSPSFQCKLSGGDQERGEKIFADMLKFAEALGPYLPGSEPHWRPYGQALHACGTTRLGSDPATSVLDPYCRVHGYNNVFVGGNNVIPTSNSVNPTLTSMVYAVLGVEKLIEESGWGTKTAKL